MIYYMVMVGIVLALSAAPVVVMMRAEKGETIDYKFFMLEIFLWAIFAFGGYAVGEKALFGDPTRFNGWFAKLLPVGIWLIGGIVTVLYGLKDEWKKNEVVEDCFFERDK